MSKKKYVDDGHTIYNMDGLKKGPKSDKISLSNKEKIAFKYTTPLRGTITSRYGYRDHPIIEDASFHTGLDIAAKQGTDIVSFAAGKVIEAGKNSTYGNYLLIEHEDGYRSFYGHNSKLLVKKGQKVCLTNSTVSHLICQWVLPVQRSWRMREDICGPGN